MIDFEVYRKFPESPTQKSKQMGGLGKWLSTSELHIRISCVGYDLKIKSYVASILQYPV